MNFSNELINHILTFRPTHPNAVLLKRDIEIWNRKRQYFYKYYLNKYSVKTKIEKLKQQIIYYDDFYFKCCKEDRMTTEQAVKLRYESKQRKQRLNKLLQTLNINPWEISTESSLRYLKAYYNGFEIFNEKK